MKVTGVGSQAPAGAAKRAGKADKADGKSEFKRVLADATQGAEAAAVVETSSAIGAVESLLMAQAAGEPTEREARRRLIRRGEDILDKLEDIRHGLLLGIVPKDKLVNLAQTVRSQREACADPRLGAILDEIELRAEVELAKLTRNA